MGASVLIFANKTDVGDCMSDEEMIQVRQAFAFSSGVGYSTILRNCLFS